MDISRLFRMSSRSISSHHRHQRHRRYIENKLATTPTSTKQMTKNKYDYYRRHGHSEREIVLMWRLPAAQGHHGRNFIGSGGIKIPWLPDKAAALFYRLDIGFRWPRVAASRRFFSTPSRDFRESMRALSIMVGRQGKEIHEGSFTTIITLLLMTISSDFWDVFSRECRA